MPTPNPRLTLTLKPTIAAQLRRLSELTGNSQASLISELLEGNEHVFARVITVLEAAATAKEQMRESITGDLEEAQARVEKQLGLTLDAFDDMARPLVDAAETIRRRSRKRAAARGGPARRGSSRSAAPGDSTPMSNRGVRSGPPGGNKPGKRGK